MSILMDSFLDVLRGFEIIEVFDGGCDALRDRWDASERDSELLRLAAGDDLGDDNGAKRFDAAAAAIPPPATKTYVCMYVCMFYYGHAPSNLGMGRY